MFTEGPGALGGSDFTVMSCMEACVGGTPAFEVWSLTDGMCFCGTCNEKENVNEERYPRIMDHHCGEDGTGGCYSSAVYSVYRPPTPCTATLY
jgi:hypothetical protein